MKHIHISLKLCNNEQTISPKKQICLHVQRTLQTIEDAKQIYQDINKRELMKSKTSILIAFKWKNKMLRQNDLNEYDIYLNYVFLCTFYDSQLKV